MRTQAPTKQEIFNGSGHLRSAIVAIESDLVHSLRSPYTGPPSSRSSKMAAAKKGQDALKKMMNSRGAATGIGLVAAAGVAAYTVAQSIYTGSNGSDELPEHPSVTRSDKQLWFFNESVDLF
uniref:Transmembrane protein n=1 Tax=Parascaris univalens TaxID=6257 RepID=A0A915B0P2_PARUN